MWAVEMELRDPRPPPTLSDNFVLKKLSVTINNIVSIEEGQSSSIFVLWIKIVWFFLQNRKY